MTLRQSWAERAAAAGLFRQPACVGLLRLTSQTPSLVPGSRAVVPSPSALSDGCYSAWGFQGRLWCTLWHRSGGKGHVHISASRRYMKALNDYPAFTQAEIQTCGKWIKRRHVRRCLHVTDEGTLQVKSSRQGLQGRWLRARGSAGVWSSNSQLQPGPGLCSATKAFVIGRPTNRAGLGCWDGSRRCA